MKGRVFWFLFTLVLIVQLVVRIIPPQNGNFYFTADQGNDAVHVREITEYGRLLLKGPETSMPGVFAGPGWYYFLAPGYLLFGGHPFGAVFMLILLSLATTAYVMWHVAKRVSPQAAILVGLSLQVYWYFYEFSRYGFNPFPTGFLTLWLMFLLADFLANKKRYYYLALFPIALAFNCAVAAAFSMLAFYLVAGMWGVKKGILGLKQYLVVNFVIPAIIALPIVLQFAKQINQSSLFNSGLVDKRGFFASANFGEMAARFTEIFSRSVVPLEYIGVDPGYLLGLVASLFVFATAIYFFLRGKKRNKFVFNYLVLLFVFWVTSYLFFSSNKAWREWHTIGLYLINFLGVLLFLFAIPKKIGLLLLVFVLSAQTYLFQERYGKSLAVAEDPGILAVQTRILDWIYTHNEEDGFNVYALAEGDIDYKYQYLFWWYGRKAYGFVPCEYSIAPGDLKLYVPNKDDYSRPTLGCDRLRFVIIEPKISQDKATGLYQKLANTEVLEKTQIAGVRIEKRRVMQGALP